MRRMPIKIIWLGVLTLLAAWMVPSMPAAAQQTQKPNILFGFTHLVWPGPLECGAEADLI